MKGKLAVLAGVGVGYVLGARAGRQRYGRDGDRYLVVASQGGAPRSRSVHGEQISEVNGPSINSLRSR